MKIVISKFNELPKTKNGWLTLVFGSLYMIVNFVVIYIITNNIQLVEVNSEADIGKGIFSIIVMYIILIVISTITFIQGIISLRKGERSWVLWLGLSPIFLIGIIIFLGIIGVPLNY